MRHPDVRWLGASGVSAVKNLNFIEAAVERPLRASGGSFSAFFFSALIYISNIFYFQ